MTPRYHLLPLLGAVGKPAQDRCLWMTLQALRVEAGTLLAEVGEEYGADSRLYRLCAELWLSREEDSRAALRYGNPANAMLILERAVELLTFGPSVVARKELELDDLEVLLRAA